MLLMDHPTPPFCHPSALLLPSAEDFLAPLIGVVAQDLEPGKMPDNIHPKRNSPWVIYSVPFLQSTRIPHCHDPRLCLDHRSGYTPGTEVTSVRRDACH